MTRRLAVVVAAVLLVLLGGASPASAQVDIPGIDLDCRTDAPIGSPSEGFAATIDPGPEVIPTGEPLKPGGPNLYEAVGYSSVTWFDLDPSCGDKVSPVDDNGFFGTMSSLVLGTLTWAVALTVTVVRLTFDPATLGTFDGLGVQVAGGFQRIFFWGATITVLVAVIGLTRTLAKARTGAVVSSLGTITAILLAGYVALAYPLAIAPVVDKAALGVVGEAHHALAGAAGASTPGQGVADRIGANLHRALLYETWANGVFGDASSEAAKEYGPRLFLALSLTRAEQAEIERDPGRYEDLVEEHREAVDEVYTELREEYPAAAEYLAGAHNSDRLGFASLGWGGWWAVAPVLLVSSGLLLFSLFLVRFGQWVLPALAVVGVLPNQQTKFRKTLDWIATTVVTAVVSAVIAAAHIAVIGGFLSSSAQSDPVTTLVLMGVSTLATFGIIWKFRKSQKQEAKARTKFWERKKRERDEDLGKPAGGAGAGGAERPAEAGFFRSTAGGAARGAAGGVVTTAAFTVASGGTLGGAALLGAAARGAAVGAVGAHGAVPALAAGTAALGAQPQRERVSIPAGRPAASAPPQPTSPAAGRELPSGAAPAAPAAPPPVTEPGGAVEVFRPTDPGAPQPRGERDLDYPIFTPGRTS